LRWPERRGAGETRRGGRATPHLSGGRTVRASVVVGAVAVAVFSIIRIAAAADVSPAVADLESRARAGDAEAQSRLGTMLLVGVGVSKDPEQAEAWLRKAAEQQYPPALFQLGTLHRRGQGRVGRDFLSASRELLAAADLGDANAKLALGLLCKPDEPDAGAALRKRYDDASNGDVAALFDVGAVFDSGVCTDRDPAFASWWYEQAAAKGHVPAMERLAFLDFGSSANRETAAAADFWLARAAKEGGARANGELGRRELARGNFGAGFPFMAKAAQLGSRDASDLLCTNGTDARMALETYVAALNGDVRARIAVADGLLAGTCSGMRADWRRWWLEQGADAGSPNAQIAVAARVLGDDVKPDVYRYDAAMLRLRQAALGGSPDAAFALGILCPKDGALRWMQSAAEAGIVEAELELGRRLRETDVVQSMVWLNIAAARGSVEARDELGEVEAAAGPTSAAEAQRVAKTVAEAVGRARALDPRVSAVADVIRTAKVPRPLAQVDDDLRIMESTRHLDQGATITEVDQVPVRSRSEFDQWIYFSHPGDILYRTDTTSLAEIKIEESAYEAAAICSGRQTAPRAMARETEGYDACAKMHIAQTADGNGTMITALDADSPLARDGVQRGDVVTAIDFRFKIRTAWQHVAIAAQCCGHAYYFANNRRVEANCR